MTSSLASYALAVLLVSLGAATTEVFAPAMPHAGRSVSEHSVVLFLCTAAAAQLATGALAGAWGHAPVGAAALAVYGGASAALARLQWDAPHIRLFYALRAAQALGASACAVLGMARVRTHPGLHMSSVQAGRGVVLVVAPMASQLLVNVFGSGQSAFACLAGVACGTLALWLLADGCGAQAPPRASDAVGAATTASSFPNLLIVWVIGDALGFAGLLVWVAHAAFAVATGEGDDTFGYWYGLTFVGSVVGAALACPWQAAWQGFCLASLCAAVCPGLLLIVEPASPSSSPVRVMTALVAMMGANAARAHASTHAQTQILRHAGRHVERAAGFAHAVRSLVAAGAVEVAGRTGVWLAVLVCHVAAAGVVAAGLAATRQHHTSSARSGSEWDAVLEDGAE